MAKYKLNLPEVRRGRTIFTEPVIELEENIIFKEATIFSLKIDFFGDTLTYFDRTKPRNEWTQEVPIAKYTGEPLDARLIYLTPEQKAKLIEDTGIPVEELDEIAAIEKENVKMLVELLSNEHK